MWHSLPNQLVVDVMITKQTYIVQYIDTNNLYHGYQCQASSYDSAIDHCKRICANIKEVVGCMSMRWQGYLNQ